MMTNTAPVENDLLMLLIIAVSTFFRHVCFWLKFSEISGALYFAGVIFVY